MPPQPLGELFVEYPEGASGTLDCTLELLLDKAGVPTNVQALDCSEPFAAAALAAAYGWRFAPALRDGVPIAARIRWLVHFEETTEKTPEAVEPTPPAAPPGSAAPAPPPPLEVTVRGQRVNTGAKRLTRAQVRELPGAFGDAFRAIEALPGVTPIASGLPYFFVRGAPPGNTGYFLDGLSLPLLYHAAVGPSVIHPAFIENVELYSGAYPARYGRFAGAVLAGTSAPPSHQLRGEASVRLVDSGAFLEVPLAGERASLMVAGRYSYTGALVSLIAPEVEVGYWDYQARGTVQLSPDHTLTLFGFGAYDFLAAEQDGEMQTVYDVTFHRLDLSSRQALGKASALDLGLTLGWDQTGSGVDERISLQSRRIGTRAQYRHEWSGVTLRAGADLELSRFSIDIQPDPDGDDDDFGDDDDEPSAEQLELPDAALPIPELDQEPLTSDSFARIFDSRTDVLSGVWLELGLELGAGVTLSPGFRLDLYESSGPLRLAPEPRLRVRYRVGERLSLMHDIGVAHQAPSFAIPVPGFSGSASAGLQRGVQTSAGLEWQWTDSLLLQWTVFQTALFGGSDPISLSLLNNADESVEAATARVTAHSYGTELYLRRDLTRRLGGFLSYTLSRSVRSTGRLEGPSSVDRTHVLNLALAYRLGDSWRLGGRYVFYSGRPGEVAYPRPAQRPPRGPAFQRLDLRVEKRWRLGETGFWALVAEVQNATLSRETTDISCYAYGCDTESIGPVTVPSLGLEAAF